MMKLSKSDLIQNSSSYHLVIYQDLKKRVFGILVPGDKDSKFFDPFIMSLIVLNVFAVVLETVDWLFALYAPIFHAFDLFSVAVFTIEYILRIWSCTVDPKFKGPLIGRLRFMITPFALVDLMAVLPFYLPFAFPELRFMRAFRLFRLFRILKLARYSESLQTFVDVLRLKKEELMIMFFAITILLVISSSLVYEAENEAQPEAFSSIPAAMWWGVVTLGTVGYGDMFPVTPMGKLIGSFVVILGIGLLPCPRAFSPPALPRFWPREKRRSKKSERRAPTAVDSSATWHARKRELLLKSLREIV